MFRLATLTYLSLVCATASAQIPHNQDQPPGPPLSPAQAIEKLEVPEGFCVSVFAAEPDLVNPVAMTFDDRGRVWIVESLEYPRLDAGDGKDRVKILEDRDGDGKADKVTIFAEGLNIPSGIAIGNGGAYVANAPDLLFLKDTDGDDRADERKVLLHGFGRTDTHELPNSLTWGPDGWLYGLNGVFNHSKIEHQGKTHEFNCALWRYHPTTKAFELFCEGTSNPWGLDYDREGNFFVSACVIDHLWHLTETGYYHRQAGPYPPFTWKIDSIVLHKHQKAAYCGLTFYDATQYPEEHRQKLFMGNIHGGCINSDALQRRGASYFGTPRPDFLTANDAWFMPVSQQVGPDGFLWILDWYDRFHCYQDARREPENIDRLKGRLYRVTYGDPSMAKPFDLTQLSNEELLSHLANDNVFFRRKARRILVERQCPPPKLDEIILDRRTSDLLRTEALWTRMGVGSLDEPFLLRILSEERPTLRAWGVRAAGDRCSTEVAIVRRVSALAQDENADVRLQVAIAAGKLPTIDRVAVLMDVLAASTDESGLTPRIVWENLHPHLPQETSKLIAWIRRRSAVAHAPLAAIAERLIGRLVQAGPEESEGLHDLFEILIAEEELGALLIGHFLQPLLHAAINGDWEEHRQSRFQSKFGTAIRARAQAKSEKHIFSPENGFAVLAGDESALKQAESILRDSTVPAAERVKTLPVLLKVAPTTITNNLDELLKHVDPDFASELILSLARISDPVVADSMIANFPSLPNQVKPQALDLLTSRSEWARELISAVQSDQIPSSLLNANQLRKLMHLDRGALKDQVEQTFGKVREERDRNREQVISRLRRVLDREPGNAAQGQIVFAKVCAQCHKLGGEGNDVGPDLTTNGRGSLDQLLSNLLDPNLVIGKDYQARVLSTVDGRILTGLLAEDSESRVVLKVAGGKLEIIPRDDIDQMRVSELSLMPEKLETQITDSELRDLISYLMSFDTN